MAVENPKDGKKAYAKLLEPIEVFMVATGKIAYLDIGTRFEVYGVSPNTHTVYGLCEREDGFDIVISCQDDEAETCEGETEAEYLTRGALAIQYLQSLAGIQESYNTALANFAKMPDKEKEYTLNLAPRLKILREIKSVYD